MSGIRSSVHFLVNIYLLGKLECEFRVARDMPFSINN